MCTGNSLLCMTNTVFYTIVAARNAESQALVDGAADCKQILRGAPKSEKRHSGLGLDCLLNAAGDHFKLAQATLLLECEDLRITHLTLRKLPSAYLSTPAARAHTITTTFPLPASPASPGGTTASYTPLAHPPRRHTVGSVSYTAPELDTAQPDADLDLPTVLFLLPPLSTRPSPPYGPPRSSVPRRTRASSASCWMRRSANAARARQLATRPSHQLLTLRQPSYVPSTSHLPTTHAPPPSSSPPPVPTRASPRSCARAWATASLAWVRVRVRA
ncbi:hypothetical protein C8J57DRAFT_1510391 [Mycena rebaudengoi]|nr:hypothetical protein C8J57DRAFT_1510391 [Mycena rebaudengoi]